MSVVFSAEEIAEKKRIALEKLRAKKERLGLMSAGTAIATVPTNSNSSIRANNGALSKTTGAKSAVSFLNDLKRGNVRMHPYQRSIESTTAPIFTQAVSCKVYMLSATRFAVQPSNYHEALINLFKSIPSKSYDPNTRIWDFTLNDYDLVQQRVGEMAPQIVIGSIPRSVLDLCRQPPKPMHRTCLASIEPSLAGKLLPFQEEGVCFAIAQQGRVMIGDEMGLGKTYQAIAIADFYRESWPLLICTTASVRESWVSHIRNLLPSIPLQQVQVLANNQQYVGDHAKVVITSYQMLERHLERLMPCKFGVLIFDESHTLKNAKAKCTKVAEQLARQAKHVILLSGTPALSRPVELFTQIQMLDRKFMTFREYSTRYCDGKQSKFGWDANGQSNLQELNVVLKLKFMIRRTKADVLPELAEKSRETVVLDPALVWSSETDKESLKDCAAKFSASKGRAREELLLEFYTRTAVVKQHAVCAHLKMLVKDSVKFVVFAHHLTMLDAITEFLQKLNVNFIRIDGSTKNELRAEYVKEFQSNESCRVAVLSLKACNAGITLTAAEMIIFAELDWNPSTLAQAESRAHRIGQLKLVTIRYLMANDTADDVIWNILKSKQDVLNRAGLFCENLQNATHTVFTTAQSESNKIDKYFSPVKQQNTEMCLNTKPCRTEIAETSLSNSHNNFDLKKELENLDEIFMDDDVFKDLPY